MALTINGRIQRIHEEIAHTKTLLQLVLQHQLEAAAHLTLLTDEIIDQPAPGTTLTLHRQL